jgi:dTDP-4-dehydrorhamnose 3,5-epimerase
MLLSGSKSGYLRVSFMDFMVASDHAEMLYKTMDYWSPANERFIFWNDATLGIKWPIVGFPIVSSKDARETTLQAAEILP